MSKPDEEDDSCELFECQICMDSLLDKQPRTLSCNHTFCHECLEQLVRFGSIKCPQCRVTTQIPSGGVKKLPLNFELAKMKEREMDIAKKFSVMCQICLRKHEHTKAQYKCIQCFQTMCKPCKQKHDKVAIFKNHNVEEIKMSQETSNVCPTHHQSISYICQKCLKGICMDCLMADEHVDHQDRVEDMGAGIKTLRNSVTEISKVLKECQERLNVKITNVNKDLEQTTALKEVVNNRKKELDNQVGKEFNKIVTCIKTRYENPMVASLDNIRSTLGRVQSAVDMCKRLGSDDDDLDLLARLPGLKTLSTDLLKLAQDQCKSLYTKAKFTSRDTATTVLLGTVEPGDATKDNITYVAVPLKEPQLLLHLKQQDGKIKIRSPVQVLCLDDGSCLLADTDVPYIQRIGIKGNLIAKYYPHNDGKIHSITMANGDLYIAQETVISVVSCACVSSGTPTVIKHGVKSRDNITVTKSGIIYHAQFSNGRILQVDKDGESREVLTGVSRPVFINMAYTDQGIRYLITEYFAHRVSIFDEEWDKMTQFGKQGSNDGCLWCPLATAVYSDDTVIVADSVNNRISQFSLRGKFVRHLLEHTHELDSPMGLGYKHPYLWVSECRTPGHNAVKLFQLAD